MAKILANLSRSRLSGRVKAVLAMAALASGLAGCASQTKQTAVVFFPPPPDPPRLQYLTSINGSGDIEEKRSSFSLFLTGSGRGDTTIDIVKPYGVTVHKGKIYVCDITLAKVLIIDPVKKSFKPFTSESAAGKLLKPNNVAVDTDGTMFVADVERKEVLVFSESGKFLKAIGKERGGKPVDVAVDGNFIYVLDFFFSQIHIYDRKSYAYLRSIGRNNEGDQNLALPTNLTLDSKGFIYVTNIRGNNVIKLDVDGHFISSFGKIGDGLGQFTRPKGISVDQDGRIYVVDAAHQNVQIFDETGRLLIYFGNPGLPAGSTNLPAGISVTKENLEHFRKYADPDFQIDSLVFVTNQFGAAKVSVYGLGRAREGSELAKATTEVPAVDPKGTTTTPTADTGSPAPTPKPEGPAAAGASTMAANGEKETAPQRAPDAGSARPASETR